MGDFHPVVNHYEPKHASNIQSLLSNTKTNICGFDLELKRALVCSRKFYHAIDIQHVTGSNDYEITSSNVVRTERRNANGSTNLEPSMVKFCSYPAAQHIFASLSNSENIEIGKIDPKTMSIESIKSDNPGRPISHSRFVNDIHWSPASQDKPKLASVCRDSDLRIWSLREGSIQYYHKFNTVSQATFVRWDPKETYMIATTIERQLKFWDIRKTKQAGEFFYLEDRKAITAKSLDFYDNYVMSLMSYTSHHSNGTNEYAIRIHDRRMTGRKKLLHEEKVYGARDARFAPDSRNIFVLTDEGQTASHHMLHSRGNGHSGHSSRTSSIKVYNFDNKEEHTALTPTAVFKSPSWSVQYWDYRKVNEDTYDIIGILRRDREGKDRYEHSIANWEYKATVDVSQQDPFDDVSNVIDPIYEPVPYSPAGDSTNTHEDLRKKLENERSLIGDTKYRIKIDLDDRKIVDNAITAVFSAYDEPVTFTSKIEFIVGYPRVPPRIKSILGDSVNLKEDYDRIAHEINSAIAKRTAQGKLCLDSLTRSMDTFLQERSGIKKMDVTSPILFKADQLNWGANQRFNRFIPFPARCGVAWSATKICVFVNAELPKKAADYSQRDYQEFVKLSDQPPSKSGVEVAGSPGNNPNSSKARRPRALIGFNRTGSIDGRIPQNFPNAQKFPPVKTILQDMTSDLNLSREQAVRLHLPSVDENVRQILSTRRPASATPPYDKGDEPTDPYRIRTVQSNLKLALELENGTIETMSRAEPFPVSIWRWAKRFTEHMEHFKIWSPSCQMRKFGQWKDLNKAEVESLVRTGLSVNEVQQVAILGAFLYSVPYMEVPNQLYNVRTFIELLNISTDVQNIIKTNIDLYANILNSWELYNQRAQLIKAYRAGDMVKLIRQKSEEKDKKLAWADNQVVKITKNEKKNWDEKTSKLTRYLGTKKIDQVDDIDHCACKRCDSCGQSVDKCFLCLKDISRLSWKCAKCSHQAHIECIKDWFTRNRQVCPCAECDCNCIPLRVGELAAA